jgi:hypothetical protein
MTIEKHLLGTTSGGKTISAVRKGYNGAYLLQFDGGGELPLMFKGEFNCLRTLKARVEAYLVEEGRTPKEEKKVAEKPAKKATKSK